MRRRVKLFTKPPPTVPRNLIPKDYYHGFIGKQKAEHSARNRGDFLIWGEETSGQYVFSLCVRVAADDIRHYRLISRQNGTNREWAIDMRKLDHKYFASIDKLIANYSRNGIPDGPDNVRMTQPATRASEMFRDADVHWDPDSIGEGNFCVVHMGWVMAENGQFSVAVKEVKLSGMEEKATKQRSDMMMEMAMMTTLRHPNVVRFFGLMCDQPPIRILMENCQGGSILTHLIRFRRSISDGERLLYAFEVARGMDYLEGNKIVHRDLAARNVLISDDTTLRISDFGLSAICGSFEDDPTDQKFRGPVRWMAPENFGKNPVFTSRSDSWAFGLVLWEIFTGGLKPFENEEVKQIVRMIRSCEMPSFPTSTKREIVSMARRCWVENPSLRPTFGEMTRRIRALLNIWPAPRPNKRTLVSVSGVKPRLVDDLSVIWGQPDVDMQRMPSAEDSVSTSLYERSQYKMPSTFEGESDELQIDAQLLPKSEPLAKSSGSSRRTRTHTSARSVRPTQESASTHSVRPSSQRSARSTKAATSSQKSTRPTKSSQRTSSSSRPSSKSSRRTTKEQSADSVRSKKIKRED